MPFVNQMERLVGTLKKSFGSAPTETHYSATNVCGSIAQNSTAMDGDRLKPGRLCEVNVVRVVLKK